MADNKKVDEQTTLQTKVFNRWISYELSEIPNSKYTNLSNGANLIELAHILTREKIYDCNQKSNSENCEQALKTFQKDGIDTSDFQAKDFDDNNIKVINEFIWKLISHYSIEKSFGSFSESNEYVTKENVKSKLLSWAVQRTQTYVKVFDFKPYDLAMCALLDSYYPEKVNYYALNHDDHQNNFDFLIEVMKKLGIPCLIFPEDLIEYDEQIDKKALLAQLSLTRIVLEIENKSGEKHEIHHSMKNNLSETPEILTAKNCENRTRVRCVSRLQEHKSEQQIKQEIKNHERRIKEFEKEDREKRHITEEQQKIEKQIVAQLEENKKAYKKRKLEERNSKEKLEKKENPIKKEIDEEFEENKEEYEMRKAEE